MPIFAQEMGFTEQSWRQWARQQLDASFHVYIHLDRHSRLKRAVAIATAPLVLFMHATNPSMHIGRAQSLSVHALHVLCSGLWPMVDVVQSSVLGFHKTEVVHLL